VSASSGTLAPGGQTTVTAGLSAAANGLLFGNYTANVVVTNQFGLAVILSFSLQAGQSLLANGGFETGDFTGWSLVGNTVIGKNIYDAVENAASYPGTVHSGSYGAFLGDTNVAFLSQTVSTTPGQQYLLSFWLDNPVNGAGQKFLVNWLSGPSNQLYQVVNPPVLPWTNLNFIVTAGSTTATVQFGTENVPNYFGLDDVSLTTLPAVAFKSTLRTANAFQLTWQALNGFSYQVQYATNLAPAVWINLGSPLTSSYGSLTVSDTNAAPVSGRCFYRLVQQQP
jgi:hypothetical protein